MAAYMKNAFIPAIAPGYVDRINAQTFDIGPDSPGFPVTGVYCSPSGIPPAASLGQDVPLSALLQAG